MNMKIASSSLFTPSRYIEGLDELNLPDGSSVSRFDDYHTGRSILQVEFDGNIIQHFELKGDEWIEVCIR